MPASNPFDGNVQSSALPSGASTSAKQDDLIAAIEAVSGLQRATDLEGNGKTVVGTTAVEIAFTGTTESIVVSADPDNTGTLYVGKSDVLSDGSNAITYLAAGDSIELDYDDSTNGLYVIASVAAQNFWSGAAL